jgi:sugar phosphate isomerase/epimerase
MGIVTYSFNINQKNQWGGRHPGASPALAFLEECHRLGAGGIQFPLGQDDAASLPVLRRRAEEYGMRVEMILEIPANRDQVAAFEQKVLWAKEGGATLARTAAMPGRRYEQFNNLAEFHAAEARALQSLLLAEPVLARQRFRLAVENHKDQLATEKLAMLRRIGSEHVGVCLDVGNNIALAEEPMEAVRALAPVTFTVHIKDHLASPYPEGYLLWDAALGDGFLDLPEMVEVFRASCPAATINLEVITRDPLKIPIRTEAYWATLPGRRDAAMPWIEPMVRNSPRPHQPPLQSLSQAKQMALELRHCQRSLRYAVDKLRI